jgi:hypothetical protein
MEEARPCRIAGRARERGSGMTAEARIAWVERGADGVAIIVGLGLWLGAPQARLPITRPMLLVAAGVVLAVGLVRDLARIALAGRPVVTAPDRHPGEVRLCLESTAGLAAVAAGLAWWLTSAGSALPISSGALVLALAAVAALGHLTRNLVVVVRREPAHRNGLLVVSRRRA